MRIYSFYGDVPELNRFDELKLSILWRERWNAAGWEPFILGEHDARKHPMFDKFCAATMDLPTVNPKIYEHFCRLRWLAMAQAGGGWMSDLDVMPFGDYDNRPLAGGFSTLWHDLTGQAMNKIQVLQAPCCPALVYCSRENAERLCRGFMSGIGNRPQGDRPHYSDQYALNDLLTSGAEWIEVRDIVKQYGDADCATAPLLHFPNAVMGPRKLTPRWRHIPGILDARTLTGGQP